LEGNKVKESYLWITGALASTFYVRGYNFDRTCGRQYNQRQSESSANEKVKS